MPGNNQFSLFRLLVVMTLAAAFFGVVRWVGPVAWTFVVPLAAMALFFWADRRGNFALGCLCVLLIAVWPLFVVIAMVLLSG